jgi:hypothetical protein
MVRRVLKERFNRTVKGTVIEDVLGTATATQPFVQDIYDLPSNVSNMSEVCGRGKVDVRGADVALS